MAQTLVRGSNPIWFEVDLTAHAFDDTFYLFILQNEIPYIPATVWQDPFGNVEWTDPIRFFANGTLPNNIYWDPTATYRLEFRQGPTQADPLIYLVENYMPGSGGITPGNTSFSTDNQISNPQFAEINFTSPFAISGGSTQVINVAPDWFLNLTGTGNVTLTQVPLNSSVVNPTNAPYALQIQLSGSWTKAYLSQRFHQNGVLWSGTFVSSNIMALSGNPPQNISAILVDSQGNTIAPNLLPVTPLTQGFNAYPGVDKVLTSVDTDLPPAAYIEYQLKLPNSCDITLTSIQLISSDSQIEFPYEQTTVERQKDQLFNYYELPLLYKPIPSFLVGWDFPLNPAQFFGDTVATQSVGANSAFYAWDQTIIFQTANSSISVARYAQNASIQIRAAAAGQFAMIQYLSANQATGLFVACALSQISANVLCAASPPNAMTISLVWTANASLPTLPSCVVTGVDANGNPTLASGWTQLARTTVLPSTSFKNEISGVLQNFQFSGYFDGAPLLAGAKYFAIIIGTSPMSISDSVTFQSVSVVPGTVATIPAPQTPDEVLRECQYYYEKSYNVGVAPGTVTSSGMLTIPQGVIVSGSIGLQAQSLSFAYKTQKRVAPTSTHVGFFSPLTGNASKVWGVVLNGGVAIGNNDIASTAWTVGSAVNQFGQQSLTFASTDLTSYLATLASANKPWSMINFHYVIDTSLGSGI